MAATDPRIPRLGSNLTKGIGPSRIDPLLDHFGDLAVAWAASPSELAQAGFGETLRANIAAAKRSREIERELARLDAAGVTLLTRADPAYPERRRQIAGAPTVLYVKGVPTPADDLALGIVGMRRVTAYGCAVTTRLAGELAAAGVSGLAKGIDAYAHDAALRAGGRTIAFLGAGVDVIYPAEHRALAARIVGVGHGALVSEYHLGAAPI